MAGLVISGRGGKGSLGRGGMDREPLCRTGRRVGVEEGVEREVIDLGGVMGDMVEWMLEVF